MMTHERTQSTAPHRAFDIVIRLVLYSSIFFALALDAVRAGQPASYGSTGQSSGVEARSTTGAAAQKREAPESAKKTEAALTGPAAQSPTSPPNPEASRIVREGIAVEFSIDPVSSGQEKPSAALEAEEAIVRFKIVDTNSGAPLTNLRPSAWMDLRGKDQLTGPKECKEKVKSFLQASLGSRPDIDLNSYYILALNQEANITVIDPLLGYGSSKLLTLVFLKSPGEDWVLSRDRRRLFVSMPLVNQIAVVDAANWKVVTNLDVGARPTRLAMQPDEKYLWVGNDAPGESGDGSGVTVIDTAELKVAARLLTGAGHHELAFTTDDRYAFVTNQTAGTLSIIDVPRLAKIKDLRTGPAPVSLAFSPLSQAVYVADEVDGAVSVIDRQSHEISARLTTKPGLKATRLTPDGRWGFVTNGKENLVHIFDLSTNRLLQTLSVGREPDQISFTDNYAYIRSLGSEQVSMIELKGLGKEAATPVSDFPGGQVAPGQSPSRAVANTIVPAPEGNAVLVANPADKMIYYYTEGMAAPMGSFQNYRRDPRAVLVVDRSLRETTPGVYATTARMPKSGTYDVAFLLDSPRIVHCFEASVKANPAIKQREQPVALRIEPLLEGRTFRVGETIRLRFKVTRTETKQPLIGLKDIGVLTFLAPGVWQQRQWAAPVGEGVYESSFAAPQSGIYYVFWQCPSLKARYNQLPYLVLQATDEAPAEKPAKKGDGNR
jgi:DNA-binding beta-propeller fold protein YncE